MLYGGHELLPHLPIKCGNKRKRLIDDLSVPLCKTNSNDSVHEGQENEVSCHEGR